MLWQKRLRMTCCSPQEQLHSDQGRQFESAVMTEVCDLLGIEKSRTTPYHPQLDGLAKRYNCTLLSMLGTAATNHWPGGTPLTSMYGIQHKHQPHNKIYPYVCMVAKQECQLTLPNH